MISLLREFQFIFSISPTNRPFSPYFPQKKYPLEMEISPRDARGATRNDISAFLLTFFSLITNEVSARAAKTRFGRARIVGVFLLIFFIFLKKKNRIYGRARGWPRAIFNLCARFYHRNPSIFANPILKYMLAEFIEATFGCNKYSGQCKHCPKGNRSKSNISASFFAISLFSSSFPPPPSSSVSPIFSDT